MTTSSQTVRSDLDHVQTSDSPPDENFKQMDFAMTGPERAARTRWDSGDSTPVGNDNDLELEPRPSIQSFGSSRMQVKKQQKRSLASYPQKGYQITTTYFYQEIETSWTVVMLIACYGVSGMLDAVTFGVWGVFVAMQTGNTVFLALRVSSPPETQHPMNYTKSLVSIGSYCLGALIFNCLHRAPTNISDAKAPLHRWTLTTSFLIQSALLVTAAILAQADAISTTSKECGTFSSGTPLDPGDRFLDLLPIALLALESAGQVCLSRVLLVNELPTIVLSTLYHDLVAESLSMLRCWRESSTRWEFVVSQKKQIRRLACILALFAGAVIGGYLFRSRGRLAAALWLAAGIKIVISIAWCVWRRKPVTETVISNEVRKPASAR